MKTKMLILAFLSLMFAVKSSAQNWMYGGPTLTGGNGTLETNGAYNIFFGNGADQMTLTSGGDLNIVGGANGYMINGVYQVWNNGDVTNTYIGSNAAGGFGSNPPGEYNTIIGSNAGADLGTSPNYPEYNTLVGNQAGYSILNCQFNTYIGYQAGYNDQYGLYNTFIGYQAGFNTQGGTSPTGDYNTFTGIGCGIGNLTGHTNSYYGKLAGDYNNGNYNCMYGGHCGAGNLETDSNSFYGTYANTYGTAGQDNVYIGMDAALDAGNSNLGYASSNYNIYIGGLVANTNQSGNYNVILGYKADAYISGGGSIYNAAVIGADAVVLNNNKFILGNNAQDVGIGMSGIPNGPQNRLEISYFSNATGPEPCTAIPSPTFTSTACPLLPRIIGTGASGLEFRDLTFASIPYPNNKNSGFLTVDDLGNVVLMKQAAGAGGIGDCVSPLIPVSGLDPAINLEPNANNFWFEGNGPTNASNNVYMGYTCGSTSPLAKLNILEASGSTSTDALFVTNTDLSGGSIFTTLQPLIGVKSLIPYPGEREFFDVAGWFEADAPTIDQAQYAIFVPGESASPGDGGVVDIGYPFNAHYPGYLLDVNGLINTPGWTSPSDSSIKKNITPFKYGLKVIRNLNPISYKYNGIGGFDSTHIYIGLIAQNLARNEAMGVRHSVIIKDATTHDTTTILNIDNSAVIYTAINAIKQLDSSVTVHQNTDSVKLLQQQKTIDSLKNVLTSIQNCLSTLCFTGDAPVRGRGGNGNSGDSNSTITNTLDVTLSASTNAPLLYQNIPNPFSTGTKINYYLPEGTIGATMVFYDTYGNQIKTVQLSQTGNGTLNITPDNLTGGIYSYSLVVNNNIIDTKRMILQK